MAIAQKMNRVVSPHRRRLLRDPSTFRNLAIDAVWSVRPASEPRIPLTWPLDPARLSQMNVRWPATYLSGSVGLQAAADSRMARRLGSLREAMGGMVRTEVADIDQPYKSVALLEVDIDGIRHEIAIDQSPYLGVNKECASRCVLYFKRHFSVDGYAQHNIVPGGFAPLKHRALHRNLAHLRRWNRLAYDSYGRFSPHFSPEIRGKVLELLSQQDRFGFEGGTKLTMYTQYLRDIASSRVCIDVPGEGPLSYRLVEYLAVGSCIVGYPHKARLHVPLVHGEHIMYTREDLSDLVDICEHLINDTAERERLATNARSYFDKYLHRDQLSAYHLHSILQRTQ